MDVARECLEVFNATREEKYLISSRFYNAAPMIASIANGRM